LPFVSRPLSFDADPFKELYKALLGFPLWCVLGRMLFHKERMKVSKWIGTSNVTNKSNNIIMIKFIKV